MFHDPATPYHTVPNGNGDSLKRYIEQGIAPGSFLMAVLNNDLNQACARADRFNRQVIPDYVRWLVNEAPCECWGSPEKVNAWLLAHKAERDAEVAK